MPRPRRASKYRAVKAEYGGERYDSKAEAAYAASLDAIMQRGNVLFYLRQPKFTLGCPENVYRPDFMIVTEKYVVADDVKGSETAKFKKDKRLWAKYGPCPLRVIRLKLTYPSKGSPDLPRIRGVEFEVIRGGRDKRVYGPLAPDWLRNTQ